jgi:hypothetical protein
VVALDRDLRLRSRLCPVLASPRRPALMIVRGGARVGQVESPRWGSVPPASDALSGLPDDRVGECTVPHLSWQARGSAGSRPSQSLTRAGDHAGEVGGRTGVRREVPPLPAQSVVVAAVAGAAGTAAAIVAWMPACRHRWCGGAGSVRPGRPAEPEPELEVSPVWRAAHGRASRGAVSAPARSVGVGGGHRGPWATCRDGCAAVRAPIRPGS